LQTVQNLLEALLNSGIPVKQHHYNEVILSNRMWPITNQHILIRGVLSEATKNKTFTPENICSSASKGRSHREYLA
jgi:G:T/U-mismatch repair DNA glycosylase